MASAPDPTAYGVEPTQREQVPLLSVLRRRALIIILTTLLCGGAAAAYAYINRDSYQSTAKLLFRQTIGPELSAVGLPPTSPDADNLSQNNVALVDSRRVAVATAQELQSRGRDVTADEVDADIAVSGQKDSEVVSIEATADSAQGAAQLANVYARTAAEQAEGEQQRLAQRTLDNVTQQLEQLPQGQRAGSLGNRLRGDIQQLRTLVDVGTGSPQIIQPGYAPSSESGNPVQTIILGGLFGVLLGGGLALLRDQADRRLHHTEDVSAAFDAPVLTTVPRHRALKRHRTFTKLPPKVSEAFRMLHTNLRFGPRGPVRSVIVTSSRSREGKTTVAWNLACASASAGLSVALVEADMRRPTLAKHYDLESGPGLSDVLVGDVTALDALQAVKAVPESAGGDGRSGPLNVLVAGDPPPDPWALTQSSLMVRVLELLRKDHDLVVVDTPPIPHVADAISLLRRVDGVIVIASVNSTRGPEAGRLRDQLQGLDARILGVVANGGSAGSGYPYAASPATGARVNGFNGQSAGRDEPRDRIGGPL